MSEAQEDEKTVAHRLEAALQDAFDKAEIEAARALGQPVALPVDEQVRPALALSSGVSPAGALPIGYVRELMRLLQEASVDSYEDGSLKIRFDVENRRALLRPQGNNERW